MCGWNFSQLFKEGSQALRGKVCLWVMFLILPMVIVEARKKGESGRVQDFRVFWWCLVLFLFVCLFGLWGGFYFCLGVCLFYFDPALLMLPGALPFISVEVLITAFHFFSLSLALQSKLQCVLPLLEGALNPTYPLAAFFFRNRNFPLMSCEPTLYFIDEHGNSVKSLDCSSL